MIYSVAASNGANTYYYAKQELPLPIQCVSAVLPNVMRRGRGGLFRLLRFELPVVSSFPYNIQECRASLLHITANRLREAAAKKSATN